jgi:cytochrome c
VVVAGPIAGEYGYDESFVVDVDVTDDISGVHAVSITLDGVPASDGQVIDLFDAALGDHVLRVVAEDVAGNVTATEVVFTVVDRIPPEITIDSPEATTYAHDQILPVDVTVTDEKSGVDSVLITLDGAPVAAGSDLDLLELALGEHTLAVTATDAAGNESRAEVRFEVEATIGSLIGAVNRLAEDGLIADGGIVRSLLSTLEAADAAVARDLDRTASNQLSAFVHEVEALTTEKIAAEASRLLIVDATAVRADLVSG